MSCKPARIALCPWLLTAVLVGCSAFPSADREPFSYDAMRRQIEGQDRAEMRTAVEQTRQRNEVWSVGNNRSTSFEDKWKNAFKAKPKPDVARRDFLTAEDTYRQAMAAAGDDRKILFTKAGQQFAGAAKHWPDSSLEQDALFLSGESYFFAERFPQANSQFEKLLKDYPNSRYLDVIESRRFAMAQYWLDWSEHYGANFLAVNAWDKRRPWRDTKGHGIRVFDRIRIDDPTGKLADDATMAAGNTYFRDQDFIRADEFYSDLRKSFPSSEHQFMAHYLGAQAKIRSYEGPDYSGVPLDEAEELLVQIRRQFPGEYERHRDDVERMYREVRFRQAERDWSTGQYYEKQNAFAAANFYYDIVAKQYAETPFAEQARARIPQLAGLPPRPPQRFEWLVRAFPDSRDDKPLVATGGANSDSTLRR